MAEFPKIPATKPDVKPGKPGRTVSAKPEIIFDKWWLLNLEVMAERPNKPVSVRVVLQKGAKLEDGSWVLSRKNGSKKEFIRRYIYNG